MIITLKSVIVLLPVLIVGTTVIIILLSIAYNRNRFFHAGLAIAGLCLAIVSLGIVWHYRNICNILQLICIDKFSILYTILVLISSIFSGLLAYKWLLRYPSLYSDEFYILLLISSIGGILLTATNHLVMLFLGIELLSLPLYGLVGYSFFKKSSLEASIKYIVLSGVSSSFLLLGIALVYADTGCLLFTDLRKALLIAYSASGSYQLILIAGLSIMMVGFGFKLSFVPFHLWIADVYQGTSYPVSMYLATVSKIAIMSTLIRFFLMFPDQYSEIFYIFLSIVACCSILFGSLLAIQQISIKRVLAYSSIAHIGYLLIGLIVLLLRKDLIVLEAIGVYLISYLISSIGVFSIIGIISSECCSDEDADSLYLYKGLFWKNPTLSVVFTVMLLSLAGMPITLGFIGKFYLFMLGIGDQLWCPVFFMIIGSIIGVFYYLKIMVNLYIRPAGKINLLHSSSIVSNWVITVEGVIVVVVTLFILFLGIYPQPIMHFMHFFLQ